MSNTPSSNNEPVALHNTRATLRRLLSEMIEQPERRSVITKTIEESFGQDRPS